MDTTELKSIKIKLNTAKSEEKKRVQCENWKFDKDNYLYENQLKFINNIKENNFIYQKRSFFAKYCCCPSFTNLFLIYIFN